MLHREWFVYCEGNTPKVVFGGPRAKADAVAHLVCGSRLTKGEQGKIKKFLEGEVKLHDRLFITAYTTGDNPHPDKMLIRVLGPQRDSEAEDTTQIAPGWKEKHA